MEVGIMVLIFPFKFKCNLKQTTPESGETQQRVLLVLHREQILLSPAAAPLLSWKRNTARTPGRRDHPAKKASVAQEAPHSHPHVRVDTCCAQAGRPQDVKWVCGVRD